MHHRSIGVRLESLGKHSLQQMYPGIVFTGAAIIQDSVGMLKFCCCLAMREPGNVGQLELHSCGP